MVIPSLLILLHGDTDGSEYNNSLPSVLLLHRQSVELTLAALCPLGMTGLPAVADHTDVQAVDPVGRCYFGEDGVGLAAC